MVSCYSSLDELALSCPGPVGEVCRFLVSTAVKPQPSLSIASALATIAVAKSHRIKSDTGLRTNLYLLGAANSGEGKNHPKEMPKIILEKAGFGQLIAGEPGSSAGLLRSLADGNGRRLVIWDEFGQGVGRLTTKGAATYENDTITLMMKLFSCANSYYSGKELANHDGSARTIIVHQPSLSILSYTTPDRLWTSLSRDFALDGFVARWLFVEAEEGDVPEQDNPLRPVPSTIISYIKHVDTWRANATSGNLEFMHPEPLVAEIPQETRTVLDVMRKFFNEEKRKARVEGLEYDALWARGAEHMIKVALTIAEEPVIRPIEMEWAGHFVTSSISRVENALRDRLGENETERLTNRIRALIRNEKRLSYTALCRKTGFLDSITRKRVIEGLLEAKYIGFVEDEFSDAKEKTIVYLD